MSFVSFYALRPSFTVLLPSIKTAIVKFNYVHVQIIIGIEINVIEQKAKSRSGYNLLADIPR